MLAKSFKRKADGACFGTKLSTPPLPTPQLFNTSTGKHIKSIASGRTVTSYKAHNRAPISTCFFSFAEKVPKFAAARTSSSLPAQHGAPLRAQKWTKLHPCRNPQQQADDKVYAFKKELETSKVSFCFTRKECFFS